MTKISRKQKKNYLKRKLLEAICTKQQQQTQTRGGTDNTEKHTRKYHDKHVIKNSNKQIN